MALDDDYIILPNGMRAAKKGLSQDFLSTITNQPQDFVTTAPPSPVPYEPTTPPLNFLDTSGLRPMSQAIDRYAQSSVSKASPYDPGGILPAAQYAAKGVAQTVGSPIQTGEALASRIRGDTPEQLRKATITPGAELTLEARQALQDQQVRDELAKSQPTPSLAALGGTPAPGTGGSGGGLPGISSAGLREVQAALNEERDALANRGNIESAAATERANAIRDFQAKMDANAQAYKARDEAIAAEDAKQRIAIDEANKANAVIEQVNPNAHWSQKGTAGKLLAGLGIALSGIGSSIAGRGSSGADAALKIINDAVDHDIDMQLKNIGQRKQGREAALKGAQTKYSNFLAATGSEKAARALTQADELMRFENTIRAKAEETNSQLAKTNAAQAAAKAREEAGKFQQQAQNELTRLRQANEQLNLERGKINAAAEVAAAKAEAAAEKMSPGIRADLANKDSAYATATKNLDDLAKLVKSKGTAELIGKHEDVLRDTIKDVVSSYKKMQGDTSNVTDDELAAAYRKLFKPGKSLQSDDEAVENIKAFQTGELDPIRAQTWGNFKMTPPQLVKAPSQQRAGANVPGFKPAT